MKLLLLNYPYLSQQLRDFGHQVISAGTEKDCDLVFPLTEYSWETILKQIHFTPDWVVFFDSLQRVLPKGLENCEYPFALFCLDSTINRFWQTPFAHIADLVLFDQKPEAFLAQAQRMNARWLP
jgi:hypothetical protein